MRLVDIMELDEAVSLIGTVLTAFKKALVRKISCRIQIQRKNVGRNDDRSIVRNPFFACPVESERNRSYRATLPDDYFC